LPPWRKERAWQEEFLQSRGVRRRREGEVTIWCEGKGKAGKIGKRRSSEKRDRSDSRV